MTTEQAATAEPRPQDTPAAPEVDWKAKAREWEKRAKANADAATRLAQIEDAQKSDAQRQADELAAARRDAETARLDALRYRVGAAAGLGADAIGRLQGSTEEELAADAEVLAALIRPTAPPVAGRPLAPQSGAVPPMDSAPITPDDVIRGMVRSRQASH